MNRTFNAELRLHFVCYYRILSERRFSKVLWMEEYHREIFAVTDGYCKRAIIKKRTTRSVVLMVD